MATTRFTEDLEQTVDQYHRALGAFMQGNHRPAQDLFSQRADVTLGNPFGPFARGMPQVIQTMERAAAGYRDGEATGFDAIARYVGNDLACIVEVERLRSKVGGRDDMSLVNLRVTSVFRWEDGRWRLVHRHADPITTDRPAESVLRST